MASEPRSRRFKIQGSMKNRCIEALEFLNGAAI